MRIVKYGRPDISETSSLHIYNSSRFGAPPQCASTDDLQLDCFGTWPHGGLAIETETTQVVKTSSSCTVSFVAKSVNTVIISDSH